MVNEGSTIEMIVARAFMIKFLYIVLEYCETSYLQKKILRNIKTTLAYAEFLQDFYIPALFPTFFARVYCRSFESL